MHSRNAEECMPGVTLSLLVIATTSRVKCKGTSCPPVHGCSFIAGCLLTLFLISLHVIEEALALRSRLAAEYLAAAVQ